MSSVTPTPYDAQSSGDLLIFLKVKSNPKSFLELVATFNNCLEKPAFGALTDIPSTQDCDLARMNRE